MLHILRFAGLAALLAGILNADVYTYTYTGANFDTYCANAYYLGGYIPCGPISGAGHLTAHASFDQPIGPNQTVSLDLSAMYADYLGWGPPSWGFYGGRVRSDELPTRAGLSLTTNSVGKIVSWDLQWWFYDQNFWSPSNKEDLSSSSGGDSSSENWWVDDHNYIIYSTSTPGTWKAEFAPEPAQTPVKSMMLLAAVAAIICIRRRTRQEPQSL
jgi:hypothetical protein